jgi:glucose/arabinose dehydrogenase
VRSRGLLVVISFVASLAAMSIATVSTATAAVPTGFSDTLLFNVGGPTAIAFTPDGRMLITTQGGALRVVTAGGSLVAAPAVTVPDVCSNSERGLLGVAVDPMFISNHFIYLYYTTSATGACRNRVSRWLLSDSNVASGEFVLIDRIHSTAGNHNGGDLNFRFGGLLYASVGDGGCDYATPTNCAGLNDAARDRHVLLGKILRVDRNGNIPAGNPFTGPGTGRCNVDGNTTPGNWCQETYAWGLRNPYRFAFDPNMPGRFYINDVGQGLREEIDQGASGADYGWNVREGTCANPALGPADCGSPPPAGMTNPIFDYGRSEGCTSITGGAFVPNGINWPAAYLGKYLFADFGCGRIFSLDPSAPGATPVDFATGLGSASAVHLEFGPFGSTQALYYTTYAGGGEVHRISYAPPITAPGAPTIGSAVAGDGQATVSWTAPASDGGSPIIGYIVTPYVGYATQGPRYFVSTATTQTVRGLTNGTTYRFRVRAWNSVGVSGFSTVSNPVTPSA